MKNPSETVNDILNELGLDRIEYISLDNLKGRPTSFKISKDGEIYV